MNLPNSITISRIATVPLLIWILSPAFPANPATHGLLGGRQELIAMAMRRWEQTLVDALPLRRSFRRRARMIAGQGSVASLSRRTIVAVVGFPSQST